MTPRIHKVERKIKRRKTQAGGGKEGRKDEWKGEREGGMVNLNVLC